MKTVGARFFSNRIDLTLLVGNALGAILYLVRAAPSWRIPEEHGVIPISGEPFVWFAGIAPVVIVFVTLNFGWGLDICLRRRRLGGRFWLTSFAVWIAAIVIDFAHH